MFTDAIHLLNRRCPARTTLTQAVGLCLIADAHFAGKHVTLGELLETEEKSASGQRPSVTRVYANFLEPDPERNPKALGWIEIFQKPTDLRSKYVRLTRVGEIVFTDVFKVAKTR